MKIKWKPFLVCLAIPLAVYFVTGIISSNSAEIFNAFEKPPLAPPSWLFPIAWAILYTLMGVASYLVYVSAAAPKAKKTALTFYGAQLAVNSVWSFLFFNMGLYFVALVWLILLWVLVAISMWKMYQLSRLAALLMAPYIAWLTFAGYLNTTIWLLN